MTYTNKHNAKMADICSLNTAVSTNKYCQNRAKNENTICSKCFAVSLEKVYKNMNAAYIKNTEILTAGILPDSVIPTIETKSGLFRFEAFGDLNNWVQAANYIKIATFNPQIKFALWTKNPLLLRAAINNGYSIPANLQIIYSSPLLNTVVNPCKNFPFIDKVFTVYTKEYAQQNGVIINCGARSCATCRKCYEKQNGLCFVSEALKKI